MKIYPKPNHHKELTGYTADEIIKGVHWLYTDVKCEKCGKVQSLAIASSTDNGRCIKCGGKTS